MKNEIVVLTLKRDSMYKLACKKKDQVLWRKAKFLRNRVKTSKTKFKREKIQEELNRNRTNPKIFWANIREIWPKESTTSIQSLLDDKGLTLTNEFDLATHR